MSELVTVTEYIFSVLQLKFAVSHFFFTMQRFLKNEIP